MFSDSPNKNLIPSPKQLGWEPAIHTHVGAYLVIVAKNPTETLHVRADHLPPEILVHHVHIKLVLVISLFPALLPQPTHTHRQKLKKV